MKTPTPHQELSYAIQTWEGLFQAQPEDEANWVNGRLVGTMRGVTPAVLAAHRGIPASTVTADMMRTITLDEAAEIGVTRFYKGTGLDLLPWGPATAALVDIGWGSGPRQAVLFAQRLAGATDDGVVGAETIRLYSNWVSTVGWEKATREVHRLRVAFYNLIIARNPKWEIYRKGWMRRADSMLPGTVWWRAWEGALPGAPEPVDNPGRPADIPVVEAPKSGPVVASGSVAGGSLIVAGVVDAITQAGTQITAANGLDGVIKYTLIAIAVAGIAFAVYRFVQDRKTA